MNRPSLPILLFACLFFAVADAARGRGNPSRRIRLRQGVCRDRNPSCFWALKRQPRRFCTSQKNKAKCPVSCRQCAGRSAVRKPVPSTTCKDSWPVACPILAKYGLCYGAYSSYMNRFCRKSCPTRPCPIYNAPNCSNSKALGMENGKIHGFQISASSSSPYYKALNARLNLRTRAWTASFWDTSAWLQIDFGVKTTVTEIRTQGRPDRDGWVKMYTVWYSNDGTLFRPYRRNGWTQRFRGNSDRNSIVRQKISPAFTTKVIQIRPLSWHNYISMRVEFYGCSQAIPQQWFKIYSAGYDQCLSYGWVTRYRRVRMRSWPWRYRNIPYRTLEVLTTTCRKYSSVQQWQWTSHGQLQQKYNRRCLTLVRGRVWKVTMRRCSARNIYQRWVCSGSWLKWKQSNKYIVPVKNSYERTGRIRIRSYATRSCKFVRYGTWQTLCPKGVNTTTKPVRPVTTPTTTIKTVTTLSTTTAKPVTNLTTTTKPTNPVTTQSTTPKLKSPPLPTTLRPPPIGILTPPPIQGTTVPPTAKLLTPPPPGTTPKPPPPPSNFKVKCGTKGRVGAIVNGTLSAAGKWPWYIGIKTCAKCNITCGGTLINDEWVVTAAHCVADWFARELFLVAGEVNQGVRSGNEQSFRCKKIIVHDNYAINAPYDHDIALLQLDKYAVFNDFVRPLCFPNSSKVLTVRDLCTVTGFGRVQQTGAKSAQLLEANVDIVPRKKCREAYMRLTPPRAVTNSMVCAGFAQGGTDACQGDSGGPLTCFDRAASKFILGGIVSWGVGCAKPNQYGVYSNTASLASWVKAQLAKN